MADKKEVTEVKPVSYVMAPGKAIPFKAGMKGPGDEVNPDWPEYKANKDLLEEHIAKKLVVQVK